MTFGASIKTCLSKFVTWQGRASRSEYWHFFAFTMLCYAVATVIDNRFGTAFTFLDPATGMAQSRGYGYAYLLVGLTLFLPSLAVLVRRLHDTDRSGWSYWVVLIPLAGVIIVLVWFCSRGTSGPNTYGADPQGDDVVQIFG